MKTKKTRKGVRGEPLFLTKNQLAYHMGEADPGTIDRWVEDGTVPPPHSRPGERTQLWRRDHFNAFVATGRWPAEAWPKGDA
jgi:hypothetical protein